MNPDNYRSILSIFFLLWPTFFEKIKKIATEFKEILNLGEPTESGPFRKTGSAIFVFIHFSPNCPLNNGQWDKNCKQNYTVENTHNPVWSTHAS